VLKNIGGGGGGGVERVLGVESRSQGEGHRLKNCARGPQVAGRGRGGARRGKGYGQPKELLMQGGRIHCQSDDQKAGEEGGGGVDLGTLRGGTLRRLKGRGKTRE